MKITFNKPKGQRILKQIDSISIERGAGETNLPSLWWQVSTEEWITMNDEKCDPNSHHLSHHSVYDYDFHKKEYPTTTERAPKTFKALINYVKRHPELKGKGYKIVASTRWVGHFITIEL